MAGDRVWPRHPEFREDGERAARAVVDALNALPGPVRGEILWNLLDDPSPTLSAIAEAMRTRDPVDLLAGELIFDVWAGDGMGLAAKLSDQVEPWATIRQALLDVRKAMQEHEPGWRCWFEWREMGHDGYRAAHPEYVAAQAAVVAEMERRGRGEFDADEDGL